MPCAPKYTIRRTVSVAAPVGSAPDSARQNGGRQQRGLVRTARRRVAEHHEDQHRDADADDAEQHLEGHRDRRGPEHRKGAQPPQRDEVAGERAEQLVDDERAEQPGRDRVRHQRAEADEPAAQRRRPGTLRDAERRRDEIAADDPADHEVEAGQPAVVAGLQRHHVADLHVAVLRGLDPVGDLLDRGRDRRPAAGGDQQPVLRAGRVDEQRRAERRVAQPGARGVLARHDTRAQWRAGQAVELRDELRPGLRRRYHAERDVVRGAIASRSSAGNPGRGKSESSVTKPDPIPPAASPGPARSGPPARARRRAGTSRAPRR